MSKENSKITFFENIYYWLWFGLEKIIPKKGIEPSGAAATFFSVFRMLNVFFLLIGASALFKLNIIMSFLQTKDRIIIASVIIPIVLLLIWYDERKYQKQLSTIIAKYNGLQKKERLKKLVIFFIYLAFTAFTCSLFPWLTSFYLP